jgi:patched domain-containing protein
MTWVDEKLAKLFYKLGVQVATRPAYFLLIPPLVAALFATGFQRIDYEIDPEYLFSPVNGHGKVERRVVEHFFPPNDTTRFNVGRITRAGRFGRVIIVAKDGGNMLRTDMWREMRILDEIIQNATAEYDGEYYTYRECCARWQDECFRNDVLELDKVLPEVENGSLRLTFPVMFNPVTWDTHIFPVNFGNTVIDADSTIVSVPAVQLVYFAAADSKRRDAK